MKHPLNLSDTFIPFERIRREPRQKVTRSLLLLILFFLLYFITAAVTEAMIMAIVSPPKVDVQMQNGKVSGSMQVTPEFVRNSLYMTLVSIFLTFIYCLGIEKRSVRTMGLTKRRAVPDYLIGVLVGVGLMGGAVLLAWAGGGVTFEGTAASVPVLSMVLFIIGWVIQGFSEELTFRGYLLMSAGTHHSPVTGVCVSSLLFAAAHLGNDGISVFACVNLTLFGILAALLFLRTDSIWCVAALYSFWNMAQGNVFGLKVSGIDVGVTFLRFNMVSGKGWLNGGAFGLEGGAAVTAVLVFGILAVFLLPQRKSEPLPPPLPVQQPFMQQPFMPMPLYPQPPYPQYPQYPQSPQYQQSPQYPQYPQQPAQPPYMQQPAQPYLQQQEPPNQQPPVQQ